MRWNLNRLYASGNNKHSFGIMCTQMQVSVVIKNGVYSAAADSHAPAVWDAKFGKGTKFTAENEVSCASASTSFTRRDKSNVAIFPEVDTVLQSC